MAERTFSQRRQERPRAIARKIKEHLGEDMQGTFRLGSDLVTMSVTPSETLYDGKEFRLDIHSPVPDTPLFSSHGVAIVIYDKGQFTSPTVRETLLPTTHKGVSFAEWDAGKQNYDALTKNLPPLHILYQPVLTEYAELLHNPHLKRIGTYVDDRERERIISEQARRRAETLFEMAVTQANDHRKLGGYKPVDSSTYAATYQIGAVEARIHFVPRKLGRTKPSYIIDFHPGEDADWEIYTFNKNNTLLIRTDVIKGKEILSRVPFEQGSQMASTLEQFDENNIIH